MRYVQISKEMIDFRTPSMVTYGPIPNPLHHTYRCSIKENKIMINEQSVATLSFDRSWCATSHLFPKLRSGYQLPRERNLRIFTISFATLFGFCCRWGSRESSGKGGGTKCATVSTRNCKLCCYSFASCVWFLLMVVSTCAFYVILIVKLMEP